MNIDYFQEEWLEEEWIEEDWGDDDSIADAAGYIAEAAQQYSSQPDGLHKAFHNTINSIKLFAFHAFVKNASLEDRVGALSEIKNVMIQSPDQHATARGTAPSVQSFTQQLTQDPYSASNQAAIETLTRYRSLHDVAFNDVLKAHEILEDHRSAVRIELEECPESLTTTLHDVFYANRYLPCTCLEKASVVCLSESYICALRLDGHPHVFGDNDYRCFDSVIAIKDDGSYQWTPVQFQLPRETRKIHVGFSPGATDTTGESPACEISHRTLDDFCKILGWNLGCHRIFVTKSFESHTFGYSIEEFSSNIFPKQGKPILLSTALIEDGLSARQKVFLAYAISKAFWQYYSSDWMNMEWSLGTIQLLRTSSLESEAPFLRIGSTEFDESIHCKHESVETFNEVPQLHRYPRILNLGLLLVQLGSITSSRVNALETIGTLTENNGNNNLYISCWTEILDDKWPVIELPATDKLRYRSIVEELFPIKSKGPKPLFEKRLDASGRRLALKDHVVRPLFELFQDMADPDESVLQATRTVQSGEQSGTQGEDGAKAASKSQSDLAWEWIGGIVNSWLYTDVTDGIQNSKRPKIAIIDTGFDSGARFVDRKLKGRLNMLNKRTEQHHWKDYWRSETEPQDNDGHGTAMLSIIHRIAPFADVCVARIAGEGEDLKRDPQTTSSNLAKAILWAAEQQKADIVSLSLGWEQEQCIDNGRDRVVSNAISKALSCQNQNLLIFAAASNYGGSKHELFPAMHKTVFSIRATNTNGKHEDFNPSLPIRGESVFGTLGLEVPASNLGKSIPQYINRTGTSAATAIAAGLAAIVIGYINIHDERGLWNNIRTFEGFQNLLYEISTEPEARKRFLTFDNHPDQDSFESALRKASKSK